MHQLSAFDFAAHVPGKKLPLRALTSTGISTLACKLYAKDPVELFGHELVNASLTDTARELVGAAARGETATIAFLNAHCINVAARDRDYRRALEGVTVLLPDGSGLSLAGRLAGTQRFSNLNGTDLFPHLCEEAAANGTGVFLLGGQPGVAEATAAEMSARYGGLKISGHQHGYFAPEDEDALIDRINWSGARMLLVGFGVPLQETWIARNRNRLKVPVVLAVGGLFDYFSNRIPRAPQAMRSAGFEWVWRLAQEPRRLAGRYILGNAEFLVRAAIHAFAARGYAESYAKASKRTLDLSIALLMLVLLGPLMAALCLLITLEDRGSPIFVQTRIGANGKPFRMLKFRSMRSDAERRLAEIKGQSEREGACFKMKEDPRITRVGRFIRRASIDELPQIFNVLSGSMSIVGPRPALADEVLSYEPRHRRRLRGKPGITCIWQVSGRADIPFEKQVEMDDQYLSKASVVEDIKLIAQTVPAVLTGRGAY